MTERIGRNFLQAAEGAVASFSYSDIAEGVGYSVFYGVSGSSGAYMTTTSSAVYSERIHTASGAVTITTTEKEYFDTDFDIIFNMPKNIKGDILVNVPLGFYNGSGGAADITYWATAEPFHYDGTTETSLTGVSGASVHFYGDNIADAAQSSDMALIKINIPSVYHFRKGETLRFTVRVYGNAVGGNAAGSHLGFAHDPANRTDAIHSEGDAIQKNPIITSGEPTQLSFHVPFVLDL